MLQSFLLPGTPESEDMVGAFALPALSDGLQRGWRCLFLAVHR